ncbi:MAG TPA: cache domain-containing protein, partial [Spirochaetota bacterium]|nr:cache domain-containing protein [Spirochaetota bacterium]
MGKQSDRHSPLFWRSFLQTSIPAFILIIIIFLTLFNFLIPLIREKYIEQRKVQLKSITDVAMNIIGSQEKLERDHNRSRELAQQTALERIRSIRYGDMDSGYFWVQNEKSIVIAHSMVPDLEGKSFREVDPEYREALEKVTKLTDVVIANKRDEFLVYDWYNTSTGSIGKKLSYIKYYEPWRWVVGTGIFIDDINHEMARILENITAVGIALVAGVFILSMIYSYFIVRFRISADNIRRALIESESAVRLRDEQLEMVFDASPFAVAIVRQTDGTIVMVNTPFTKLTGYEQSEVIGKSLVEMSLLSEPDYLLIRKRIAESGKGEMVPSGNISGSLITHSGEVLNVIFSALSVNIGGDQCFAMMLTDITDERRLQEQLYQAQKMDTVGHLAGGIAHDFNNMLTGILGSAEVIKKSSEENGNEEIREYIDIVIEAAGRAAELTSKLLAFS